jgi:hypothetical protein
VGLEGGGKGGGGGGDRRFTGYEAVALQVGEAALFEEDIGFVEEEDCGGGLVCGKMVKAMDLTAVPFLPEVQDRVEVLLNGLRLGADVSAGHVVQRHLGEFGDTVEVSPNVPSNKADMAGNWSLYLSTNC